MFLLASDKSKIIRSLIISTFSGIPLNLKHLESCDDINNTYEVLDDLGAIIKVSDNGLKVKGYKEKEINEIYIDESASLLRFIIPFLIGRKIIIHSTKELISRPLGDYLEIFGDSLKISGLDYLVNLENFDSNKLLNVSFNNPKSSQFISGIMMYQALILNKGEIKVSGEVISQSYIDKTIEMLALFGYNVLTEVYENYVVYSIKEIKKVKSVELDNLLDENSLSYMMAISFINKDVEIKSEFDLSILSEDFINIFKKIGCNFNISKNKIECFKSNIVGSEIDISNHIDLAPTLMVLGCFSEGFIALKNTNNLKFKESNRIESMRHELIKVGVDVKEYDNYIIIDNSNFKKVIEDNFMFECFNDHRIAMSLVVLNSYYNNHFLLDNLSCIDKSYPNFLTDYVEISNLLEE